MNLKNNNKYKKIRSLLKILDRDIISILREENFLNNLVKKNIEYLGSTFFLEYVFYEDKEEKYGSRDNDISFSINMKLVNDVPILSYNIVSEFKDFEENNMVCSGHKFFLKKLNIYKKECKEVIFLYIKNHKEKREIIPNSSYFFDFITNIDKNIMAYLKDTSIWNLKQKVLDYGVTYDEGEEVIFYATYAFYKSLKSEVYQDFVSRYKLTTLLNDDYDVHKNTYSFQMKIIDKRVYFRIIPNENKRFKLISERLNEDTKEILNIESKKFIAMMKDRVD